MLTPAVAPSTVFLVSSSLGVEYEICNFYFAALFFLAKIIRKSERARPSARRAAQAIQCQGDAGRLEKLSPASFAVEA